MSSVTNTLRFIALFSVFCPAFALGCGDEQPPSDDGTGSGTGGTATGGTSAGVGGNAGSPTGGTPTGGTPTGGTSGTSTGGTFGGTTATGGGGAGGVVGGSGGTSGSGGSDASGSGGTPSSGGSGGSAPNGGAGQAGTSFGGMAGSGGPGGRGGRGGASGSSGSGGSSMGGSNGCTKGQTEPSEVILIGDSFIALNHSITDQIETRARAAGLLTQNQGYRDVAVSGATLAGNNQIPSQYASAVSASPVEVVLMDGGGNDCIRNAPDPAFTAAQTLFQTMAQRGTKTVVYFFYPDPVGSNWASLKSCLDALRPRMKTLCEGLTSPKCYCMDLRTMWQPSYAQADGIHPTVEGGHEVGDAVWETMQQNCIAQ
ncbi:MAG TPA: SGNH/GDSL hydrolase family protein [Polyangiaceae bacterium]